MSCGNTDIHLAEVSHKKNVEGRITTLTLDSTHHFRRTSSAADVTVAATDINALDSTAPVVTDGYTTLATQSEVTPQWKRPDHRKIMYGAGKNINIGEDRSSYIRDHGDDSGTFDYEETIPAGSSRCSQIRSSTPILATTIPLKVPVWLRRTRSYIRQ